MRVVRSSEVTVSSQTSDRIKFQTDREYYAELWGTDPHAIRRNRWTTLRSRSSLLATVAGTLLLGHLTLNAFVGTDQSTEVVSGSGAGRSFDTPVRMQRVSSAVGLVDGAADATSAEAHVDARVRYPDRTVDPRLRFG